MPPPSTVCYRRDLLGRIVAAGDEDNPSLYGSWTYRSDGQLAAETLGSGRILRTFVHDSLGRPTGITEPAQDLGWSFRHEGMDTAPFANGGISSETVSYKPAAFPAGASLPQAATVTYTYDAFGRMTHASSAQRPALDQVAAYDANGNLSSLSGGSAAQAFVYVPGTNRLASVAPAGVLPRTFHQDAAGRVTTAGATRLVRDPATGRVRRARTASHVADLLAGPWGKALHVTGDGRSRRLEIGDLAGRPLVAFQAGATSVATHVHGATGRIALWLDGALYAISKDLRDSTRIAYDGQGKAAAWFAYRAYGTADEGGTSAGPVAAKIRWRFTGQEWDEELALYDYGARLYDPTIGQFLSPDPEDETASPYAYVGGDPVDYVDPDGRMRKFFSKGGGSFNVEKNPKITRIYKFRGDYLLVNSREELVGIIRQPENIGAALDDLVRQYRGWNAKFGNTPEAKGKNPFRMKGFGDYTSIDAGDFIALAKGFQKAQQVTKGDFRWRFGVVGKFYEGPPVEELTATKPRRGSRGTRSSSVGGSAKVISPPSSPRPVRPLGDPTPERRARNVLEKTKGALGVSPSYLGPPHPHSGYNPFSSVLWRRSSVDKDFFVLAPPKPKTPPPSSDSI